jgi:hypothetical protein
MADLILARAKRKEMQLKTSVGGALTIDASLAVQTADQVILNKESNV